MDTKAQYNKEAGVYDEATRKVNIYFDEALNVLIQSLDLDGNIKILDVCCGTGILTELICNRLPSSKVVALDFAENMLEVAKNRLRGRDVEFICTDILELDMVNEFDLVVSSYGIHNIRSFSSKQKAFSAVSRAMKLGAQFITCDLLDGNDEAERQRFFNVQKEFLLKHYSQQETEEWLGLLEKEDDPETWENNKKLLKLAGLSKVELIWRKDFLAIWTARK